MADGIFAAAPEKAVVDMLYLNIFVDYAEEAVESNKADYALLQKYGDMSGVKSIKTT